MIHRLKDMLHDKVMINFESELRDIASLNLRARQSGKNSTNYCKGKSERYRKITSVYCFFIKKGTHRCTFRIKFEYINVYRQNK
jgi:hypothetical protein